MARVRLQLPGKAPSNIVAALEGAANDLGGVGTKTAAGNTIGCCAEFHGGNELLLQYPQYGIGDLQFTPQLDREPER